MLNQAAVREATRLTRAGRLAEATALLQHMLQGDSAPGPTSRGAAEGPLPQLDPPTIDLTANIVGERVSPPTSQAGSVQRRNRTSSLKPDFSGLGLRGPISRSPRFTDIAPEGTEFIAAPSTTRPEAEATSCSSQVARTASSFP
jgi:hypothetical protein